MSMKNSIDTIGNQTSDLPACRVVPQPTGPPRALIVGQEKLDLLADELQDTLTTNAYVNRTL
jgi:hypothetical protein